MNTKEQIMQEIEQVPEPLLIEILEFVRFLKVKSPEQIQQPSDAVQAFLASLEERQEVYQRLADSEGGVRSE